MERNYSQARLNHDLAANDLITHLLGSEDSHGFGDGIIYFDFPLFRDLDDVLYRSSVLLASRSHGLILFKTVNPTGMPNRVLSERADQELTQLDSIIFSKLIKSKLLRKGVRDLKVPLCRFLYAGGGILESDISQDNLENSILFNLGAVDRELSGLALSTRIEEETWEEMISILEGAKGLMRPKDRHFDPADTTGKAATLARLEQEIANFDRSQRKAAITIVEGPQRIRGLAGSGKTVVLAMKAAQIHLNDPNALILYTFYTKSLYDFIRGLITRFYRHYTDRDPDFEKIQLRHGWGSRDVDGVYYDACIENGVRPLSYKEAVNASTNPFEYVCDQLLTATPVKQKYDYVLIDEAQDFPSQFYRLCFDLTRGGSIDRNVIWAYDELQNIMNVKLQSPVETFGCNSNGEALVDLERAYAKYHDNHDIVLYKCYRNPREILICAHALGFGIYSDNIVQMLESKEHWEDVGYEVEQGNCRAGEPTIILRPTQNSPLSISETTLRDELVKTFVAESVSEEVSFVCGEIKSVLEEGLRADDVLVVALDDRYARKYFQLITKNLAEYRIDVNNLLLNPYSAPSFSRENRVTLSTVWRAKGNEAPVVFAIGIDAIYDTRKTQVGRNKLFTSFTRAKAWLRVSGTGVNATPFMEEIALAMKLAPQMQFTYPDLDELYVVQRDLNDQAAKILRIQRGLEAELEKLDLSDDEKMRFLESLLKKKI